MICDLKVDPKMRRRLGLRYIDTPGYFLFLSLENKKKKKKILEKDRIVKSVHQHN